MTPTAVTAAAVHNVTDPFDDFFDCSTAGSNATLAAATPLVNNTDALEVLREWCAISPRCAPLYGQDGAPNLDVFQHIFQTTIPAEALVDGGPFLESPLLDWLCNHTAEEFLMFAWAERLIAQYYEGSLVCDVNERFVLDPSTGTGSCECLPGRSCRCDEGAEVVWVVILILFLIVAVAVAVWFMISLASRNFFNDRRQAESFPAAAASKLLRPTRR